MSDEDEAAPVVIVIDIVLPGVAHIVVLEPARKRSACAGAGEKTPKSGQRDLPVHRSVRTALRSEARELLTDDIHFGRIGSHVAVRRRIGRYGRINVEAIDRRLRVGSPFLLRQLAIGSDDRGREIDIAGIMMARLGRLGRPAQPRLVVGVVVWGSLRERGARETEKREKRSNNPVFHFSASGAEEARNNFRPSGYVTFRPLARFKV